MFVGGVASNRSGHKDLYPLNLPFGGCLFTLLPCTKVSADRSVAERSAESVRDDEPEGSGGAEAAGDATRGGTEPAEEGIAGGAHETRRLPMGFDRGVGADEDWRPHLQVVQGAETIGLQHVTMIS